LFVFFFVCGEGFFSLSLSLSQSPGSPSPHILDVMMFEF
jgi:hypothetical protein